MEATTTFGDRVDQLDARLREFLPALSHGITCERAEHAATWRYGRAWGTLALHETDSPPRLSLMLYNEAGTDEQDAVEVTIDEDDVIGVLAEPLAGLFIGRVT
jgi:hypothetical protein